MSDRRRPVEPLAAGTRKSTRVVVSDQSTVGEARRVAASLAERVGFDETDRGTVAIVASEAAANIVRHAGRGELLLRVIPHADALGLELLALDSGPGIGDVGRALRDGYSTAGTSGTGLGAIGRLSARWDLFSAPGLGTALVAECWPRRSGLRAASAGPGGEPPRALDWAVVCVPKPGEEACGDDWGVVADRADEQTAMLGVVDGLGHGPLAADASAAAARVLYGEGGESGRTPEELIRAMHEPLRGTRGAAVAVARVDRRRGSISYAGVGNVAGTIVAAGETQSMVSHPGIVGHEMRKVQPFEYRWPEGALVVMASDGLGTQWRLTKYPGLATRHPALVAGILYRDFGRQRDDMTVLVARNASVTSSHGR